MQEVTVTVWVDIQIQIQIGVESCNTVVRVGRSGQFFKRPTATGKGFSQVSLSEKLHDGHSGLVTLLILHHNTIHSLYKAAILLMKALFCLWSDVPKLHSSYEDPHTLYDCDIYVYPFIPLHNYHILCHI